MLRSLLYLTIYSKTALHLYSTRKMLIKSQVILHRHTQNLLMIYIRMSWLQLHWIKVYNAQSYAFLRPSHSNVKAKLPSPKTFIKTVHHVLSHVHLSFSNSSHSSTSLFSTVQLCSFQQGSSCFLDGSLPFSASLWVLGIEILVVSRNSVCGDEEDKETHKHTYTLCSRLHCL